jgi:hypothetical protein
MYLRALMGFSSFNPSWAAHRLTARAFGQRAVHRSIVAEVGKGDTADLIRSPH